MRTTTCCLVSLVVVLTTACGNNDTSAPDDGQPFYSSGDLVELVNPYAPGGGSDVAARFLMPYFDERLAGNPTTQVVHLPGAGGIVGANQFVQSMEPDGSSVLFSSASNNFSYLFGEEAVQYNFTEMIPLMGLPTGRPLYLPADFPSVDELVRTGQEVAFAIQNPLGAHSLDLIGMHVLGLNIQPIAAYDGTGPMVVAFEQGEVDMFGSTTGHYQGTMIPMFEAGIARPFYAHGQIEGGEIVRDPAFPDIPTLPEVYEELYGEAPSGLEFEAYKALIPAMTSAQKIFFAHGTAPPAMVQAWHDLCEDLLADDEFFEAGMDAIGPYRLLCGDDLRNIIDLMTSLTDDHLNWALDFLVDNYDAPDPRS